MTDPTKEQIHCLQHALGLDYDHHETRNYYGFDAGDADIESLIAAGMMERYRTRSNFTDIEYARCTDAGKAVAWQRMPPKKAYQYEYNGFSGIVHELTAGKARYSKFLDLGDCYPDIRLTDIKVRRCKAADRQDPYKAARELGLVS